MSQRVMLRSLLALVALTGAFVSVTSVLSATAPSSPTPPAASSPPAPPPRPPSLMPASTAAPSQPSPPLMVLEAALLKYAASVDPSSLPGDCISLGLVDLPQICVPVITIDGQLLGPWHEVDPLVAAAVDAAKVEGDDLYTLPLSQLASLMQQTNVRQAATAESLLDEMLFRHASATGELATAADAQQFAQNNSVLYESSGLPQLPDSALTGSLAVQSAIRLLSVERETAVVVAGASDHTSALRDWLAAQIGSHTIQSGGIIELQSLADFLPPQP